MSSYLFYNDVIDDAVSFPITLLVVGIDVIKFRFFNELLFKFSLHDLFISLHSSQHVIYVVAFSHSVV